MEDLSLRLGIGLCVGLLVIIGNVLYERYRKKHPQPQRQENYWTPAQDVERKPDRVSRILWLLIFAFIGFKLYRISITQSLANELDISNPSLLGLLATLCMIVLMIRNASSK